MSKIAVQVGYIKNKKKTQIVKAFLNEEELDWNKTEGMFLTTHKDRVYRSMIWYMCSIPVNDSDLIRFSIKTFLPGIGIDEEKTFESLYSFKEEFELESIEISGVGMKRYPLIKGRVEEVGLISEEEKRINEIDDFLNEVF